MKPGRQLDALVAEKVMGMTVEVEDGEPMAMFRPGYSYRLGPVVGFSTDIACAWEVVEKLEDAFDFRLWGPQQIIEKIYDEWQCEWHNKTTRAWYAASADTAPHAICLAALKALGAEAPDGEL